MAKREGQILDPDNGVRGYTGVPMLSRSQLWVHQEQGKKP